MLVEASMFRLAGWFQVHLCLIILEGEINCSKITAVVATEQVGSVSSERPHRQISKMKIRPG